MAAELAELVTELREVNTLTGLAEDNPFKLKIRDLGEKLPSESKLSDMFKTISDDVKIENDIFVSREINVSEALSEALSEGNLEKLFKAGGIEIGADTEDIAKVFKFETREIPERILNEEEQAVRAARAEVETPEIKAHLDEVDANIEDVEQNERILRDNPETKNVVDWFERLRKTIKYIVVGGIVIFLGTSLAQFLYNYVAVKSGAFLISSEGGIIVEFKIPEFSCVHKKPGNQTTTHPFRKEILGFLGTKPVCGDVALFDECSGWASMGSDSRLGHLKVDFAKLGKYRILKCRTVGVFDALFDLAKVAEDKLVDVFTHGIKDVLGSIWDILKPLAPIVAGVGGAGAAFLAFLLVQKKSTVWKFVVPITAFVVVSLILYYVIKNINLGNKPAATYYNYRRLSNIYGFTAKRMRPQIINTMKRQRVF